MDETIEMIKRKLGKIKEEVGKERERREETKGIVG